MVWLCFLMRLSKGGKDLLASDCCSVGVGSCVYNEGGSYVLILTEKQFNPIQATQTDYVSARQT